ncbi:TPA: GDP-mannose 4,6-dehydratase [Enterococcus faecium]
MTIIVTGSVGFIGFNFVFHMLNKYPDYRIICLDKLTYAGNMSTLAPVMDNPNFRFVKADICDREAVFQLFEEEHPDMVVNFAADSHVDRSIEDPGILPADQHYRYCNFDGCLLQVWYQTLSSGFYRRILRCSSSGSS